MTGAVVGSVAVASPALAKAGTGAKQNLFGVVGADSNLGGGMSNYFAESDTDSPYSPYSHGETSLYATEDQGFMLKVKIDVLKDTQKRLQTVPGFIEGAKWEEIRSLLTAKVRPASRLCCHLSIARCFAVDAFYPMRGVLIAVCAMCI